MRGLLPAQRKCGCTRFGTSAMTNDSKFCDETVTRRHSAEAEFWALVADLGIDLNAMVDPRTELSFAMARRRHVQIEGEMPGGTAPARRDTQRRCCLLPLCGCVCRSAALPTIRSRWSRARSRTRFGGSMSAVPSMVSELMHRRPLAGLLITRTCGSTGAPAQLLGTGGDHCTAGFRSGLMSALGPKQHAVT